MTKRLQPIRLDAYKPLREVVSETLRQAIQDGVLKPGERLMEIPLAEELGVSRTPIREAIRKLELEGFVVMVPRRGTYVANISLKDITQVFEIRSALEELASSQLHCFATQGRNIYRLHRKALLLQGERMAAGSGSNIQHPSLG